MRYNLFSQFIIIFFFISSNTLAKDIWLLDKNLSTINFEIPVLFANNVKGGFKEIEGLIEINIDKQKNNKAIFSVRLDSIDINYKKYKKLILSDIFFNAKQFPIAFVNTKKFSYKEQEKLNLNIELSIKGINKTLPIKLEVYHLAKELIQIKSILTFSRTDFKIGIDKWDATSILKDKIIVKTNLFLFKRN